MHLMDTNVISQQTATPSCKEASSYTTESEHSNVFQHQHLQDVGSDIGPSVDKQQTSKPKFAFFNFEECIFA